jgi:hypothetical protein
MILKFDLNREIAVEIMRAHSFYYSDLLGKYVREPENSRIAEKLKLAIAQEKLFLKIKLEKEKLKLPLETNNLFYFAEYIKIKGLDLNYIVGLYAKHILLEVFKK